MADERGQRRLERLQRSWEKEDKRSRDDAVLALVQHKNGRKFLWWLFQITESIGVTAFTGNALTTAYKCGQQDVGHQILAHLTEVAPDGFLTMMKENADERSTRDLTSESAGAGPNTDTSADSESYPDV